MLSIIEWQSPRGTDDMVLSEMAPLGLTAMHKAKV